MTIRMVAFAVIAALLLTGGALAVSPTPENGTVAVQPTTGPGDILTSPEAEAAALTHAGLTAQEVTELRSHLDREDGILEWDVDFRQGDYEFDYSIHAETGKVLQWDKEYDPIIVPTEPAPPAPVTPKTLTADEALEAALSHAGLVYEQIDAITREYDTDDALPEWEIEFRSGEWEYDYTIHAETGEILKWSKEQETPKTAQKDTTPKEQPAATEASKTKKERLSASEVKAIALSHAGLSSGQVRGLKAEFDYDDGVPEYDVEFYYNGYEYEYEIHAETGKILSWDKEYDD